jgi:hypothetical protein
MLLSISSGVVLLSDSELTKILHLSAHSCGAGFLLRWLSENKLLAEPRVLDAERRPLVGDRHVWGKRKSKGGMLRKVAGIILRRAEAAMIR